MTRLKGAAAAIVASAAAAAGICAAIAQTAAPLRDAPTVAPAPLTLDLSDYAAAPITRAPRGTNTMAQLARVNFMRDEPGGQRFFVNDLNGNLYLLDKSTKQFTTYLNFNGKRGGLFPKFTFEANFATGLTSVLLDPDYQRNGVFYTIHLEEPGAGSAAPLSGVAPGLDLAGYATTQAVAMPSAGAALVREAVLIEWTDSNTGNATFEGAARELMRHAIPNAIHPMGDMAFNPAARPGDPDWRVMYVAVGDSSSGETNDSRRLNPQRLDTFAGKILRIIPDLRLHGQTSTLSENGRYRIPNDNPFVGMAGARKEIWAYGLRNPHRLSWNVDPARPQSPDLLAFIIGSNVGSPKYETIAIIRKGANYGYPLREGTHVKPPSEVFGPLPPDGALPLRISDSVVREETVQPRHNVIQYETGVDGDAIAGGFVYRGRQIPALHGKLIFGDITTGRLWYADIADVIAADDGKPETLAPFRELESDLRKRTEEAFRARGGEGETLPGGAAASGRGRVDMRLAVDHDGELYILTKPDGMIRKIVGAR